jgi:LysM repeat protein
MRSRLLFLPALIAAVMILPATAAADYAHVVTRGESLASVAATDGLSVSQLAAANGLSPSSQLVRGSTLQIPPQGAGSSVSAAPSDSTDAGTSATPAVLTTSSGGYTVRPGDTLTGIAAANGMSVRELASLNGLSPLHLLISGTTISLGGGTASATPVSDTTPVSTASGGYTVRPGDTLTGIAAANGMSVDQLASLNGLSPLHLLISGTTISLGGGTASATPVSDTTPVSTGVASSTGAQPTAETVTPGDVGSVAAANGVSPSLAEAIGYQESGFNNDLVSRTGATGVMQIEPGTWSYIGSNLATPPPLSPASASDNVRGGVLLLHSLLDETGGDPALAAAGYYQGLASVRAHGMYADTQRYVASVMALRSRFGGP